MGVCDVTPGGDFVDTTRVLELDSVANVCKLAVFKDEEVVALSEGEQREDGVLVGEVLDDIDVGLDEADVWAQGIDELEELLCSGDVDGCAEV